VERKLGVEFGIISIKSPDHEIVIEDCTFANNQYGNQELTVGPAQMQPFAVGVTL
jgi:hypothetical protein